MKRLLNVIICVGGFLSSLAVPGPGPKAAGAVLHGGTVASAGVAGKANVGVSAVDAGAAATAGVVLRSDMIANTGAARFQFKNLIAGMEASDSMLIIFDRYDHTGAGIVYQVFAADGAQGITVPCVPPGKYYVTVQCIGIHRDRLEKVVTIKSRRRETVRIELAACEAFSRTSVFIPVFHPNPTELAVVRFR